MVPDIADAIGLKYGRFSLWAKTIFYMEQVKVEIVCLRILATHSCRHINELESDLKYFKRLEETRAKEASILMAIWKQQQDLRHEVCNWSYALDKPITVNSNDDAIIKWMCANLD